MEKTSKMKIEEIKELFKRYKNIENEISLLREDKKELLKEFKDKVDTKAFQAALQVAKIKARLKPEQESSLEDLIEIVSKDLTLEDLKS